MAVLELWERDEQGFALVIAHYNYPLRFRSCGPKANLGEPAGMTLPLHPPLGGICPKTPDQSVTLSLDSPLREPP